MKFLKSLMLILACLLAQPMFGLVTLDNPAPAFATAAHVDQNYSPGASTLAVDVTLTGFPAVQSESIYLNTLSTTQAANIINGAQALSQGSPGYYINATSAGMILISVLTLSLLFTFTARHAKARLHRLIRTAAKLSQETFLSLKSAMLRSFTMHPKYGVKTHTSLVFAA